MKIDAIDDNNCPVSPKRRRRGFGSVRYRGAGSFSRGRSSNTGFFHRTNPVRLLVPISQWNATRTIFSRSNKRTPNHGYCKNAKVTIPKQSDDCIFRGVAITFAQNMALGGKHTLPGFEQCLEELRADILLMATLVRRSLSNAKTGFVQRNADDCSAVIADDEEVDLLEKQVGTVWNQRSDPFSAPRLGLPHCARDRQAEFTPGKYL
jgi:hypothetical protein